MYTQCIPIKPNPRLKTLLPIISALVHHIHTIYILHMDKSTGKQKLADVQTQESLLCQERLCQYYAWTMKSLQTQVKPAYSRQKQHRQQQRLEFYVYYTAVVISTWKKQRESEMSIQSRSEPPPLGLFLGCSISQQLVTRIS